MNTQITSIVFFPPATQSLFQDDEKSSTSVGPFRSPERRAIAAASCVFKSAGTLLAQQPRGLTAQNRANRLVAELYKPGKDFTAGGGGFRATDPVAPPLQKPELSQKALSPLEFLKKKWHDTSSKITVLSGLEKQTQQAWRELQKDPQVQGLKQATEQRFQQEISVTTVPRERAQFGCRFDYELSPSGIEFNPAIGIADDLDEGGKKRCLLLELTNLSVSDQFSSLAQKAIDGSISREEYIRKKEEIELQAQKTIAAPIAQALEKQGMISPANTIYFTDPQVSITGDLKKLRDLHHEEYGKEWDRLNQAAYSPSLGAAKTHHPAVHVTGDPLVDDILQGAFAHTIEHRIGKKPVVLLETASEAARKEVHSSDSPFRDRVVSAGAEIGMLSLAGAATGIPGFLAIPGTHLVAKGAVHLEETTQEFLQQRSPEEFSLDGGGEYPNMYDMAVVGNLAAKGAQIPSKALHKAHHAITDIVGRGLDKIGITDENLAHVACKVGQVVLDAAIVDSQDP